MLIWCKGYATDYVTVVSHHNGMVRQTFTRLSVSMTQGPLIAHCMDVHGQVPTPKLEYKSQWEEST
jgi:hypothetical protein